MNSVDIVKKLCRENGISVAKLERELGFANGYIRGLKKGVFPSDRLEKIAKFFDVPSSAFSPQKSFKIKEIWGFSLSFFNKIEVIFMLKLHKLCSIRLKYAVSA